MDAISDATVSPPWSVLEFTFHSQNTDSEFVVMCNYRQFILSASADCFSQSPALKDKYLFFLKVADNHELDGYTLEDFYDWIIEPLLPEFRQLPETTSTLTLQHFIFPKTQRYDIQGDGDQLVAVPSKDNSEITPIFGIQLPEETCAAWPSYDPKEIQLPQERNTHGPPSYTPSRVLLKDGKSAFFKPMRHGDEKRFTNEIEKYKSIQDADLTESLRISRLIGLVQDDTDRVFGLLLTFIDCGHRTLLCAAKPDTSRDLRQRWSQQVNDAVRQLHAAGVIWGDAKPDNVLVDQKNDAWLIDFGGGYTNGWVSKELSGTVEGDLQGLEKINEFLLHGSL
ncbi:kinase subdomain-containing protein [Fusarium phyllophilum]|uniref:Kinase subdomain-containing protein n=1 Tax=Fusarium phyllophilum TaxID=47803 RepID=A0A8H5N668_9HYPO|nr:kinase subdomain-containing protein [Fusarium phyllophilum]